MEKICVLVWLLLLPVTVYAEDLRNLSRIRRVGRQSQERLTEYVSAD